MNKVFILILFASSLFCSDSFRDYFPNAIKKYSFKAKGDIVDIAVDELGDSYILYEFGDSVFVQKVSFIGNPVILFRCSKGITAKPTVLRVQCSRDGGIVLVWGIDTDLNTPINWVFDSTGKDILPAENILKYAEWLQVSLSGKYFTCQGFNSISVFPDIYDRSWNPIEWRKRTIYHGYFVGSSDSGDILLMTEADSTGTTLSLTELPSQKPIFRHHLEPKLAVVKPHRARSVLLDGCIVMNAPYNFGGTIFGFDSRNGVLLWEVDPFSEAIQMERSFDGEMVVVVGSYCVQIIDKSGKELAQRCYYKFEDRLPFQKGIPDVSFWGDRKIIAVALYYHSGKIPVRTTLISFGEDWSPRFPREFLYRIEGFIVNGKNYLLSADGRDLEVFELGK